MKESGITKEGTERREHKSAVEQNGGANLGTERKTV